MTIFGWDASHYDAPPNGALVVSQGFSFMTHKAGGDSNDSELGAWWTAVKPYHSKLLLGAYWVLRPDLEPSANNAADDFIARLDSQCPGWRDAEFILQADCEEWNQKASTKPNKAYISAFCKRVQSKMPKLNPLVYASQGQYQDELTGVGFPLWNARYVLGYQTGTASGLYAASGGDNGKGWARYSGQDPIIWQFTSSATIAAQTTCDANAFKGTLAQLTALAAPGWAATATEDIVETADINAVVNGVINGLTTNVPFATGGGSRNKISAAVWDAPTFPTPDGTDRSYGWSLLTGLRSALAAQAALIQQLVAASGFDYTKLSAALAPELSAAVLAALPADADGVTQDELNASILNAFHSAFGSGGSTAS